MKTPPLNMVEATDVSEQVYAALVKMVGAIPENADGQVILATLGNFCGKYAFSLELLGWPASLVAELLAGNVAQGRREAEEYARLNPPPGMRRPN